MPGIPYFGLFISGILSNSEGTSHVNAALSAANALVGSHLDYCNFLFMHLSALDLNKIPCIQNYLK